MKAPDASEVLNDSQLAVYIAELHGAWQDCSDRLNALEDVVNPPKADE